MLIDAAVASHIKIKKEVSGVFDQVEAKKYSVNTSWSLKIVFMENSTANLIDEIFAEPEIKHGLNVFEKASTEQEFSKNCHFKTRCQGSTVERIVNI